MKILLIEDNTIIGLNIKEFLEDEGFQVELYRDWENGQRAALREKYDIFLFDIMLPMKNWFEIAKTVRENKIDTPIIFLTAKEDLESKEKWFWIWADDYITKPFKMRELVLRIKSILKRINKSDEILEIKIWDIKINLATKEVERLWISIHLTPKEFMILEYLMKNKWKVISKNQLLEYIWWVNNDIWSDTIRSHIKWLREKLNHPNKSSWKYFGKDFDYDPVITVRWMGFKFEEKNKNF